ncbi:MAG: cupin domain-containing protein, partial [Gaiellales bacterium]
MGAPVAHWDEVASRRREAGHIRGTWTDLGRAAGSRSAGLRRIAVDPGRWATPAHVHEADEEIFYVLDGAGISWQDGACFEVAAGDCLVHLAAREAHTLRAGPEGLDVLAFGTRTPMGTAHWPRTGTSLHGRTWTTVGEGDAWDAREAAAGEPERSDPADRPASVVKLTD